MNIRSAAREIINKEGNVLKNEQLVEVTQLHLYNTMAICVSAVAPV